jgi:hypothetical protein
MLMETFALTNVDGAASLSSLGGRPRRSQEGCFDPQHLPRPAASNKKAVQQPPIKKAEMHNI